MTETPKKNHHRARKRFGQNFLLDPIVIDNIVSVIAAKPTDHLIEIGPGLGALTEPLLERCPNLTVVEIDRDLADILSARYAQKPGFKLHRGNALQTDFAALSNQKPMRIVGNLPYNISTPLLFHLLTFSPLIIDMYFMLQKEVVDRLAASPGNKIYGRLSVMMQYHCQIQPLFTVPPTAFKPSPKVTSAVVRLAPHTTLPSRAVDPVIFERLVKLCFQQRRKSLRNSLKILVSETTSLSDFDVDLKARPETLSVADFVTLSNQLSALS
ncbi:MAG: 16S rRNA (adenine(1518)-N(6)/adenine(1519)-N(6))-dimethyltransferase [Gammaproteobacteria bacterium]|nr:MAG: 16S rRNA (adenine(1518)-N(6)/adenine(1519)-N(6))-dimethyltransferase [Gammaproteobacteria bacterium]RLA54567.1 MAG: 16S rRNA (adenine(1518)-N(6)/adenine(1519)-N(6))-dimethyltransferase [Gammaproteobacteria bacterium]